MARSRGRRNFKEKGAITSKEVFVDLEKNREKSKRESLEKAGLDMVRDPSYRANLITRKGKNLRRAKFIGEGRGSLIFLPRRKEELSRRSHSPVALIWKKSAIMRSKHRGGKDDKEIRGGELRNHHVRQRDLLSIWTELLRIPSQGG